MEKIIKSTTRKKSCIVSNGSCGLGALLVLVLLLGLMVLHIGLGDSVGCYVQWLS